MTKTEIYEALARGEWHRIEFFEQERWWSMPLEDRVLFHLHYQVKRCTFNPESWRMRKDEVDR